MDLKTPPKTQALAISPEDRAPATGSHHPDCFQQTRGFLPRLIAGTLAAVLTLSSGHAETTAEQKPALLHASQATLTGNLKLLGENEAATIHYWNNTDDTITWTWTAPAPGNYRAELNYSLDPALTDARVSLAVGDQRIDLPVAPTAAWTEYKTFPLGIIPVEKAGEQSVVLKGIRLPSAGNAAFPDIAWLTLVPDTATQALAADFTGKPIFDGTSLDGWEGDLKYFRIADGAVVAGSLTESIPQNEFLATTREYGDFELRLKARLTGGKGNGGIQFRSHRVADSREMEGYQADCAGGYWGGVYDESRRNRFLGTRLNEEATKQSLKPDDWNDYVIRCEGPRTRVWLNGVATLDYTETDPDIPRKGHIALQIHSGEPAEASYKDILLQELPAAAK